MILSHGQAGQARARHPRPAILPLAGLALAGLLIGLTPAGTAAQSQDPPADIKAPLDSRATGRQTTEMLSERADWLQSARQRIVASEYAFSAVGDAVQAPNRAHNFRARLRDGALEVMPRTSAAWRWTLRLAASRPEATTAANARAEMRHDNGMVEWFENSPLGLKHNITVTEAGADNRISLELALGGDLAPALSDDGTTLLLRSADGTIALRYGQLKTFDADGDVLPSRFDLAGATLRIIVDATGARYPVTVDPLITTPSWEAYGIAINDEFGWSVATAGDVNGDGYSDIIIGRPLADITHINEGAAYVYYGGPNGPSRSYDVRLTTNMGACVVGACYGAQFGYQVGTAGDVNGDGYSDVFATAPGCCFDLGIGNLNWDEGAVYVYYGSSSGLTNSPDWHYEGGQGQQGHGINASTAGDVNGDGYSDFIMGLPSRDSISPCSLLIDTCDFGRVMVWYGSSAGLGADNREPDDYESPLSGLKFYGIRVAYAGDVDGDGYGDVMWSFNRSGEEHGRTVLQYGGSGGLSDRKWFLNSSNVNNANPKLSFGTAGDVNGDGYADILIGLCGSDGDDDDCTRRGDGSGSNQGAVLAFYGKSGGLDDPAGINGGADWAIYGDYGSLSHNGFGVTLGTAGDLNGDGYADIAVSDERGEVFVWFGGPNGLQPGNDQTDADQILSPFGTAVTYPEVATAGDVNGDGYSDIIIGDPGIDQGWARVYYGAPSALNTQPQWTHEGSTTNARYGSIVARAGDVNGDGYGDFLVSAPYYDALSPDVGRVELYLGGPTGPADDPDWVQIGGTANAQFGVGVCAAGDVDNDGYDDVLIGAPGYASGSNIGGRVYLYRGFSGGLYSSASWIATGMQAGGELGWSCTGGDFNGDGYSDIALGARLYDVSAANEGAVFIWYGNLAGLGANTTAAEAHVRLSRGQADAGFGFSVTAGDFNGDGRADLAVGAPLYESTAGELNEGAVFVYRGEAGTSLTPLSNAGGALGVIEGNQADALLGFSVANAGDTDGDGRADLLIGWQQWDGAAGADEGRVSLYRGLPSDPYFVLRFHRDGAQSGARLGEWVASAGDVNNDGLADVLAGASRYNQSLLDRGAAYAWYGRGGAFGANAAPDWSFIGSMEYGQLGSVAGVGDVNGDGYADVLVGEGFTSTGKVYLFPGNDTFADPTINDWGQNHRARQFQGDNTGPLALMGKSNDNSVRLRMNALSPFGRGSVKLQRQVETWGQPFGAANTTISGAWQDSGLGGFAFASQITGLEAGLPQKWRARVVYRLADTPFQPHGPWFSNPVNGVREAKFRTELTQTVVSAVNTNVMEGNGGFTTMQFLLAAASPATSRITVTYVVTQGTASNPSDYEVSNGNAILNAGQITRTISVLIKGDTVLEPSETFTVTLTGVQGNARLGQERAIGTIVNDDGTPDVSVAGATVSETRAVVPVTFTLSNASTLPITLTYRTDNVTAIAGADYVTKSGTLVIPAGQLASVVSITLINDAVFETAERFNVLLLSAQNADLGDSTGEIFIVSDDSAPTARLEYATALSHTYMLPEGTPGIASSIYTNAVKLYGNASSLTATVYVQAFAQSATSGIDFANPGIITLVFPPGTTSRDFSFGIVPDLDHEPNETLLVRITGHLNASVDAANDEEFVTIVNDDPRRFFVPSTRRGAVMAW